MIFFKKQINPNRTESHVIFILHHITFFKKNIYVSEFQLRWNGVNLTNG